MTGAYLRVKRDGIWENIEVEHLTDKERHMIFIQRDSSELIRWLNLTCEKLRENESFLDELIADGVIIAK